MQLFLFFVLLSFLVNRTSFSQVFLKEQKPFNINHRFNKFEPVFLNNIKPKIVTKQQIDNRVSCVIIKRNNSCNRLCQGSLGIVVFGIAVHGGSLIESTKLFINGDTKGGIKFMSLSVSSAILTIAFIYLCKKTK